MSAREAPRSMRDCLAQLYKTVSKYKSRTIVSTAPRSESGTPGVDDGRELLAKPGRRIMWRPAPPFYSL